MAVTQKATPVGGGGLARAEQEARDPPELHLHRGRFTFLMCIVFIDGTKGGGGSQSVSAPPGITALHHRRALI